MWRDNVEQCGKDFLVDVVKKIAVVCPTNGAASEPLLHRSRASFWKHSVGLLWCECFTTFVAGSDVDVRIHVCVAPSALVRALLSSSTVTTLPLPLQHQHPHRETRQSSGTISNV